MIDGLTGPRVRSCYISGIIPVRLPFHIKVTKRKILSLVKRILIGIFILFGGFLILNAIFPLPDKIAYSQVIRDAEGQILHAYLTPDDKWRMYASLDEISPLLRKTILAKEDRYFYRHPGINPISIFRACFQNITRMKRTSGASTITMQVARALRPAKRNLLNKVIESFMAIQLEWKYSKEEILQLYLNLVPYGGNIEGVKAASLLYFKKDPDHLSLAEITALSIIPNRPSSLVIGKSNDMILQERNRWLQYFAREKVFEEKEIEDALKEPLTAERGRFPRKAPHLSRVLKNEGVYERESFIRQNYQFQIEKLVADYVRQQKLKDIHNASVIVIDNKTNQVISYVGSANFYDTTDAGQVNGARAVRQPGSTLKPLLYALCFDEGLLTPKTVITDVPVNYGGYAPENYDRRFNGYVTVERSLELSLNIPAVKSLASLGKDKMIGSLMEAGFRQVRKDQGKLGLSMVLGGCGATLEELTALFASFAKQGVYSKPLFAKDDLPGKNIQLVSPEASFLVTDILSRVNRPDFPLNWSATEHMPKIAWKTGTSYGRRDAWSIGYNQNYTVGVWVGNFSGKGVADLSGSSTATPLLFRIFNTIDYDSNVEWFNPPPTLDIRQVCAVTGLPPGQNCKQRITDYFIPLASTQALCEHLKEIPVSMDEKFSYCASCLPESGYKKKWYNIITPEMQAFFREQGKSIEMIPQHSSQCERIFQGKGPLITSPRAGHEYFISGTDPQPILLSAQTSTEVSRIYWYINDKFYKSASAGEAVFFQPPAGPVKISCTDDKGRNRNIRIIVKTGNF